LIAESPADRVPAIERKRKTFRRRAFNPEELRHLFEADRGEWKGMFASRASDFRDPDPLRPTPVP
jgi:hypothetical protein